MHIICIANNTPTPHQLGLAKAPISRKVNVLRSKRSAVNCWYAQPLETNDLKRRTVPASRCGVCVCSCVSVCTNQNTKHSSAQRQPRPRPQTQQTNFLIVLSPLAFAYYTRGSGVLSLGNFHANVAKFRAICGASVCAIFRGRCVWHYWNHCVGGALFIVARAQQLAAVTSHNCHVLSCWDYSNIRTACSAYVWPLRRRRAAILARDQNWPNLEMYHLYLIHFQSQHLSSYLWNSTE